MLYGIMLRLPFLALTLTQDGSGGQDNGPGASGPFQSPLTSAHGELVEPSATVLRQAQDERVVNFPNFEKALPASQPSFRP